MPEHKEISEEAVATALGYVAQTIQILAAYTGQALVYPVTCIGSRSLIKDGISGMVGPRMYGFMISVINVCLVNKLHLGFPFFQGE